MTHEVAARVVEAEMRATRRFEHDSWFEDGKVNSKRFIRFNLSSINSILVEFDRIQHRFDGLELKNAIFSLKRVKNASLYRGTDLYGRIRWILV